RDDRPRAGGRPDPGCDSGMTIRIAPGIITEPSAAEFGHAHVLPTDPLWFKKSVFYEVLIQSYFDSNGDGTGDLRGLASRLDYLAWLGVDCLWLPPFDASPLRDGGYDGSYFPTSLPKCGTVEDFDGPLAEP